MTTTRNILLSLISVSLFGGGIALLSSRVEFWSLFLGLPATQIGIIFLILIFERLSKKTLNEEIEEEMLRMKKKKDDYDE